MLGFDRRPWLTGNSTVRVEVDQGLGFNVLELDRLDLVGNLQFFQEKYHFPGIWPRRLCDFISRTKARSVIVDLRASHTRIGFVDIFSGAGLGDSVGNPPTGFLNT
jgi:hypothetical protein